MAGLLAAQAAAGGLPDVGILPRTKAKGKAKGKGKAKSKAAKAKAKAKAKALAMAAAAAAAAATGGEVVEGAPLAEGAEAGIAGYELAIPAPKAKAHPMKKKAQAMLAEKDVDEVISEQRSKLQKADAILQEKEALENAQKEQAEAAKKEYGEATTSTQKAIADELEAAARFKELNEKKMKAMTKLDAMKTELLNMQKKVAQMEVLYVNQQRMKELKDRQEAASKAAEDAKRQLLLQRQKEKEALEATRKALADMKGKGSKGAGRGVKRPAEDMTKSVHPCEADTLAVTQPDAAASQDID